jgi:hypothetical protein
MRNRIGAHIHDASLGIWQDDANDKTFRSEVFGPIVRLLRDRGWKIGADPSVKKNHPIISHNYRFGHRDTLRVKIKICGRCIEVNFWSMTAALDNRNGREFDFYKMKRMSYLDRLRVQIERRHIIDWLGTIAPVKVTEKPFRQLPAVEAITADYAENCHSDKELGRPVCKYDSNAKSADNKLVQHGSTVWFFGHDGRMRRGTAYYNINSMWWVVCDKWTRKNLSCHDLYVDQPADVRTKRNVHLRRQKLEKELSTAITRMDFQRAETIKQILFGNEEIWLKQWEMVARTIGSALDAGVIK